MHMRPILQFLGPIIISLQLVMLRMSNLVLRFIVVSFSVRIIPEGTVFGVT